MYEVNEKTIEYIKSKHENDNVRVINLVKSIENIAEKTSDDPFLIGLKERAEHVEELYEDRQISTQQALEELKKIYEDDLERKKEQAKKGFDGLTYFINRTLLKKGFKSADTITQKIKEEFVNNPNWKSSEKELRELRSGIYYAILEKDDDIDKAASFVDELFNLLFKANDI